LRTRRVEREEVYGNCCLYSDYIRVSKELKRLGYSPPFSPPTNSYFVIILSIKDSLEYLINIHGAERWEERLSRATCLDDFATGRYAASFLFCFSILHPLRSASCVTGQATLDTSCVIGPLRVLSCRHFSNQDRYRIFLLFFHF
jgi:hypothetical protein